MSETIHFIIRTYADVTHIFMGGAGIAFLAEISAVNVDVSPLEGHGAHGTRMLAALLRLSDIFSFITTSSCE